MRTVLRLAVTASVLAMLVPGPVGSGPAAASVNVASDMHGSYDGCVAKIRAAHPLDKVIDKLDKSNHTFKVVRTKVKGNTHTEANDNTDKRDGTGTGGTLYWNPDDTSVFSDGVAYDACATLFHEMSHLSDIDSGTSRDDVPCNSQSKVSLAEVKATRAENAYRRTQPDLKDHLRTAYGTLANGGGPLPPEDSRCDDPPPYRKPGSSGCNMSACGVSDGDPHLTTFDQTRYDFQAVGEFHLVTTPGHDLEIQVRQSPVEGTGTVSVNRAVAVKVGADRYGIYLSDAGMVLRKNGAVADPARVGGPVHLEADGSIGVGWPDGSRVLVHQIGWWGLTVSTELAPARKGKVSGLLGDFDGTPANDLFVRGGAPIAQPETFAALYPKFADSWRIAQADSLFDYGPGESTATFTDRAYPSKEPATTPAGRAAAEAVCKAAGVTDPVSLQNCVLDVALSGQAVFADAAAATQPVPNAPGTGGGTVLTVSPGGTAGLTFQGTAGQKVFVDVPASTLPDSCSVLTLRAPDKTTLSSGCIVGGTGMIDRTVLPADGPYTVSVTPGGTASGTATVRIDTISDDVGPLTIGTPTTVKLAGPGAIAERTFQGTAGQKVFIDVPSSTLPDDCGVLSLHAPDGTTLSTGCVVHGIGFIDGTDLPTTGTYTIRVDPSQRGTGTAQLKLTLADDQKLTTTIGGPPVTATISQAGAVTRVTFPGTAGQKVGVTVTSSTLPDQCGVLTLRQPNGDTLTTGCIIGGTGAVDPVTLPASGTYTLVVDPAERNVGTAVLRVQQS